MNNQFNKLQMLSNRYSVLYVEDDDYIRAQLEEFLQKLFTTVWTAKDGEEGWRLFVERHPDIVVTDINMPGINGVELIKKIREAKPEQTVMAITGQNESDLLLSLVPLQVNAFLIKPINFELCISTLRQLCQILFAKEEEALLEIRHLRDDRLEVAESLLDNIAHHWRQPLSIIMLSSESIKDVLEGGPDSSDKKEIQKHLDNILQNAKFLNQTIARLSSYAHKDVYVVEVELREYISQLINDRFPSLVESGAKCTLPKNMCRIQTYPNQLGIALAIVLENAKESILKKREAVADFSGEISLEISEYESSVEIFICDNGVGMKPELQMKIFEPYFTTKFKSKGVGLSLYLAQYLVRKEIGGELWLSSSTEGEGSCIGFRLPKNL